MTKDDAWRQKAPAAEKRVNLEGLPTVSFAEVLLSLYSAVFKFEAEEAKWCICYF
jgi:hypothetical protein